MSHCLTIRQLLPLLLWMLPLVPSIGVQGQEYDFATEWAATLSVKPWKGGGVAFGEKVRLTDNSTAYRQSKTSVVLSQSLLKRQLDLYDLRLRFGAGYTFINRLNTGSNPYYENQHRLMLQGLLAWRYGSWRIASRIRLQATFRDELRGDYRYNPKLALRERLTVAYETPGRPWKFSLHNEGFCRLNDPRGTFADEWRCTAEASRILDRHSTLSFYAKYFHELQVADPLRMFCLGVRYDFE